MLTGLVAADIEPVVGSLAAGWHGGCSVKYPLVPGVEPTSSSQGPRLALPGSYPP